MPVILEQEDEDDWLSPDTPFDAIVPLLRPFPTDSMEVFQVSTQVNSVHNNHPDLVIPI
jgi:putative SOS response-associated peptidase YedK